MLLQAHDLGFAHPGHTLFAGLSFDIAPGLSLVRGGDGRGKTTLLRLIAGEIAATGGRIERAAAPVFFETPADPAHDAVPVGDWLVARQQRFSGWRADIACELIDGFGLAEHIDTLAIRAGSEGALRGLFELYGERARELALESRIAAAIAST